MDRNVLRLAAALGTGTDAGRSMCPPMVFPAPTSQPCAASTAMCVMGAMTQAQFDACIMADPMAMACDQCIFQDVVNSCTAMAGCDDEYGNLLCCFDANCPMPTEACLMGPCGTQTSAVDMCLAAGQMSRSCGISARCFQTASGFAPDFARPQLLNRFPLDIDAMRLGSTRL